MVAPIAARTKAITPQANSPAGMNARVALKMIQKRSKKGIFIEVIVTFSGIVVSFFANLQNASRRPRQAVPIHVLCQPLFFQGAILLIEMDSFLLTPNKPLGKHVVRRKVGGFSYFLP